MKSDARFLLVSRLFSASNRASGEKVAEIGSHIVCKRVFAKKVASSGSSQVCLRLTPVFLSSLQVSSLALLSSLQSGSTRTKDEPMHVPYPRESSLVMEDQ